MDGSITEKLWAGTYTDDDIEDARSAFAEGGLNGSVLSSILYTLAARKQAHGNEDAHARLIREAAAISDAFVATRKKELTPEEWEIRQAILKEAGRTDEALSAIQEGLLRTSEATPIHVRALLELGEADIHLTQGNERLAKAKIDHIETLILSSEIDRRQLIRLYRGLVRYYKKAGNMDKLTYARRAAEHLIAETDAKDQEQKLHKDLAF